MEVKINKEIRNYTENIFFGLSLRQFIFSVLSCVVAVFNYFIFKDVFGTEITSWICIFSVLPFAILGFVTYNGMKAEEVIWNLIKYEFLVPRKLTFKPTNFYNEILKERRDKD